MNEIVAEDRGSQSVKNERKERSGESTLNKTAIMPECVNKERVSDKLSQEESSGKSVLDENAILISGCCSTFNPEEKCVVAGCDSCIKILTATIIREQYFCKCRGRRGTMPVKELSDRTKKI